MDMEKIRDKLQSLKDEIIPRKLGYYKIVPSESFKQKLPESQRHAQCYAPITSETSSLNRELDTLDYAAGSIKRIQKDNSSYKGLIFDPQLGAVDDIQKAMQMYAEEYKLPISTIINGKIQTISPTEKTLPKQNVKFKFNTAHYYNEKAIKELFGDGELYQKIKQENKKIRKNGMEI